MPKVVDFRTEKVVRDLVETYKYFDEEADERDRIGGKDAVRIMATKFNLYDEFCAQIGLKRA